MGGFSHTMSDRQEVSTAPEQPPGGAGKALARKVMIALTLALAPIGFLAAFLSVLGYAEGREESIDMIEARAEAIAEEIDEVATADGLLLRTLAFRFGDPASRPECLESLERIVGVRPLFSGLIVARSSGGGINCAFTRSGDGGTELASRAADIFQRQPNSRTIVFFTEPRDSLVYAVRIPEADGRRGITVLAIIPLDQMRERLRTVVRPVNSELTVQVAQTEPASGPTRHIESPPGTYAVLTPTEVGGLQVRYEEALPSFPPRRVATIVIPPLMWLAALIIAWLTLRRLVLGPLRTMRLGLEDRAEHGDTSPLAPRVGDTAEFITFASAFDSLAAKQRRDRSNLEKALAAQQRLVREVHHRVKNNLQIITSLLSIKARETDSEAEQRAYGVIQMRVEALALVHRWLYADDASRGVDVAALLNDLLANLETSISGVVDVEARFSHKLDRVFVGQDIAVPLAFTITELLASEAGRLPPGSELIGEATLSESGGECLVTLASPVFTGLDGAEGGPASASDRIIQGMARQLRGSLEFDEDSRTYSLRFPAEKKTV